VKAVDVASSSDGLISGFVARNGSHIVLCSVSFWVGSLLRKVIPDPFPIQSADSSLDIKLFYDSSIAFNLFPFRFAFIGGGANQSADVLYFAKFNDETGVIDSLYHFTSSPVSRFDIRYQNPDNLTSLIFVGADPKTQIADLFTFSLDSNDSPMRKFYPVIEQERPSSTIYTDVQVAIHPSDNIKFCYAFARMESSSTYNTSESPYSFDFYRLRCIAPFFTYYLINTNGTNGTVISHSLQRSSSNNNLCVTIHWMAGSGLKSTRYFQLCLNFSTWTGSIPFPYLSFTFWIFVIMSFSSRGDGAD